MSALSSFGREVDRFRIQAISLWTAGSTILLGSFLLFEVQPLIAKRILPTMGGSAAVWTTCMLFFQGLLLASYAYAHLLSKLSSRTIVYVHLPVLAASLLCLPLNASGAPAFDSDPIVHILGLLLRSVGLPYFALAATSPLVQTLLARDRPNFVPYRLFALSNVGSLVALLAYPIGIEPIFALTNQSWMWSAGYVAYVCLVAMVVVRGAAAAKTKTEAVPDAEPAPSLLRRTSWILYSMCASLILLAATTHLSACIAPIPLIWIVPLALYLISFIVTFDSSRWYKRAPMIALSAVGIALLGSDLLALWQQPLYEVAATAVAVFVCCTTAHGELVRVKPSPRHLTGFYLSISVGGALGGLVAGVIAPKFFSTLVERPFAAALFGVLLLITWGASGEKSASRLVHRAVGALLVLGLMSVALIRLTTDETEVARGRNFYGAIRVVSSPDDTMRSLMHGQILHGAETMSGPQHGQPLTYYSEKSGLALAMKQTQARGPLYLGVVGLGIGSSLEYVRPEDHARAYELDPLVVEYARTYFDVLPRHADRTDVVLGDARLRLEREPTQNFDVLTLDAFSGDAIPMHLLTLEAFKSYERHVKPDGFLCVHISNRYLDLQPIVFEAAKAGGWSARYLRSKADKEKGISAAEWVILTRDPSRFDDDAWKATKPLAHRDGVEAWTDDYSSLWAAIPALH